ncbi:MAG: glycyl-radical enzyme activating protein [Ruminococcaceae bacterium]|nr:glycyl-radical enzyme activating protein [Oscillospiraceae bacterium]
MNIYEQQGRIFDIQRYSIHDGPGIRTIVFLKGCYLHCRWCCNPESQEYKFQELTQGGKTRTVGRDVTVAEVMDEILKDAVYYSRSGGGVTLSGGECMAQPEFSEALLRAVHEYGFSTAVETTAFASREVVERLLPHIDLFMMDIKHMDSQKHEAFCGKPNEQILENAKFIAENAKEMIVRVPTVPTFNATEEEIAAIARFTATLPRVKELHLLPYHRLGQDKYAGLGREYTLAHILPPTGEEMERLAAAARAAAPTLHVHIGGN